MKFYGIRISHSLTNYSIFRLPNLLLFVKSEDLALTGSGDFFVN